MSVNLKTIFNFEKKLYDFIAAGFETVPVQIHLWKGVEDLEDSSLSVFIESISPFDDMYKTLSDGRPIPSHFIANVVAVYRNVRVDSSISLDSEVLGALREAIINLRWFQNEHPLQNITISRSELGATDASVDLESNRDVDLYSTKFDLHFSLNDSTVI